MLGGWLGSITVGEFHDEHLQRTPWASPGTARDVLSIFGWRALGRVLAADPAPDVLVVARGELVDEPPPRSLDQLVALFRRGLGLSLRRLERSDPALAGLAARLGDELPGEIHVQAFVTAGGTHGFGWHFDVEDVFIVQTAGIKDYHLRENTVVDPGEPAEPTRFQRLRAERSPLAVARLLPGDFLYVPSRWWHMALCHEHALSLSIGVVPRPNRRRDPASPNPPRLGHGTSLARLQGMNEERDKKQKQQTGSDRPDQDPQGSERDADAQRPGGPRYHGAGWERADEDTERGREPVKGPRADDPVRVDPGAVPGTKASPDGEP